MWTGILVTLVFSAGAFGLTEKEWKTAVIEYFANWTIAADSPQHDGFWDLYAPDAIHLGNGMPAMNCQEYRQFLTNRGYFPHWLYLGFVELLYSNEEVALAVNIGVSRTEDGVQINSKVVNFNDGERGCTDCPFWNIYRGVRLFKIEDGRVKEWVGIFNNDY